MKLSYYQRKKRADTTIERAIHGQSLPEEIQKQSLDFLLKSTIFCGIPSHLASQGNIFRIWPPSKRCPKCTSILIRLKSSVSFKDKYQYWMCDGCFLCWPEHNGILASEMKTAVDQTERSIIE